MSQDDIGSIIVSHIKQIARCGCKSCIGPALALQCIHLMAESMRMEASGKDASVKIGKRIEDRIKEIEAEFPGWFGVE